MKKHYKLVPNNLGNAEMLSTCFQTLVGVNLGAIFTQDSFSVRLGVFLFGIFCLLGLNLTAKYIKLNSPTKAQAEQVVNQSPSKEDNQSTEQPN